MELTWTRRYAFQAVHKLDSIGERMHGHEYFLEVTFTGSVDEADRAVAPVLKRLHGRELSFIEPATGERIVDWIHEQIALPSLKAVALQETRKNRFISTKSGLKYV